MPEIPADIKNMIHEIHENSKKVSQPTLDKYMIKSDRTNIPLTGNSFIYCDTNQPKHKTPVSLLLQKIAVKLKPSKADTIILLASDHGENYLYLLDTDNEESIRGVCLHESAWGFVKQFYLFPYKPLENYLAWTESSGIQIKEITPTKNIEEIINDCVTRRNNEIYTIAFRQIPDTLLLFACIDCNVANVEIENVYKDKNRNLCVDIKSKINHKKFTFVSKKIFEDGEAREKNQLPSKTLWQIDDESARECRGFQQKGYCTWFKKDSDERLIARFIDIKDKNVYLEQMDGKKVEIKFDDLSEINQEFISKKQK
jgi:hypothetical protein